MINCCYIVTTSSSALLRSFFLLSSVRWCLHRCTNWTSLLLKTLSIPNSYMSKGHFKSSVNSQKKRSADTLSVLGGGTHSPTPPAKTAEKKQHLWLRRLQQSLENLFYCSRMCFASLSLSGRKIIRNVIPKGPAQVLPTNEVTNSLHHDLKAKGKKVPCRKI